MCFHCIVELLQDAPVEVSRKLNNRNNHHLLKATTVAPSWSCTSTETDTREPPSWNPGGKKAECSEWLPLYTQNSSQWPVRQRAASSVYTKGVSSSSVSLQPANQMHKVDQGWLQKVDQDLLGNLQWVACSIRVDPLKIVATTNVRPLIPMGLLRGELIQPNRFIYL